MKLILFPDSTSALALKQGMWMTSKDSTKRADELVALPAGLELGLTLLDTVEIYADGRQVPSQRSHPRPARAGILVSKAYP